MLLLVAGSPLAASAAVCGNGGPPELGEGCDDGNTTAGDGCSAYCTIEACGNNILDPARPGLSIPAEICDPGQGVYANCTANFGLDPSCAYSLNSTVSCDFDCTPVACGDGYQNGFVELCDPTAFGWTPATCDPNCTPAACGDGTVNAAAGELCDDGNAINSDGCDNTCRPTGCGSYIVNPGEQCDDGGTASPNGDGCDQNCKTTLCGNGIVTATGGNVNPEACDDGNVLPGDGCDAGCQFETCQNGLIQAGEQCDDANNVNGDGCDVNCKLEICGNGILQAANFEQCDDGANANGDGCDSACKLEKCGNGIVQTGETCDPNTGTTGNPLIAAASTAGCDKDCTLPFCQDNLLNTFVPEQCDDGNAFCGDGCRANCTSEICGDGLVDCGELCDDGNVANNDGCDSNCDTETCGNFVLQPALGEVCDDGNLVSADGCDANCKPTGCGNGVVTGVEGCDDGNLASGDGCDANCTPTACGNGIKTAGEECDDGNLFSGDNCSNACGDELCGNGIVGTLTKVPPEQCDDGNATLTDGCPTVVAPYPGAGCFTEPDADATKAGPYLLGPFSISNDGCEAATYSTATPPNQKPSKPTIRINRYDKPGQTVVTLTGYFNPARKKVCEDGLTSCTTNADCSLVPGTDSCGIPRPNLQGAHIELRNLLGTTTAAWIPVLKIDVPGERSAPGGEYQQKSATPVCGNAKDGWKVVSSEFTGRTIFSYANFSGLIPAVGDVDGTCTLSAQGLKAIKLTHDTKKDQWQYSVTIRNTTLTNLPTIGVNNQLQGTMQSQVALGAQSTVTGADDPGDVGNCADAQFRGAASGGGGSVATCKVLPAGLGIQCK